MRRTMVGVVAIVAAAAGAAAGGVGGSAAERARPAQVDLASDRLVDLSHPFNRRTIYWPTATALRADEGRRRARPRAAATTRPTTSPPPSTAARTSTRRSTSRAAATPPTRSRCARLVGAGGQRRRARAGQRRPRPPGQRRRPRGLGGASTAGSRAGTIVLLRTGWSRRWPDARRYLGTAERGAAAVPKLHFPGLSRRRRRAGSSPSGRSRRSASTRPASTAASRRRSRRTACSAPRRCPVFENVAGLERLPAEGFHVIALPMKIEGGSGGPLRAMAIVDR